MALCASTICKNNVAYLKHMLLFWESRMITCQMSDRGCLHDWTSDTALNKPPQLTIFRMFSQLTAGGIETLLWLHWERLESGSIQTSSPVSFPFTHFALYPFTVRNLSHWCSVLWILPANYQNWSALGRPLPPVHYSLDVLKNFLVGRETLKNDLHLGDSQRFLSMCCPLSKGYSGTLLPTLWCLMCFREKQFYHLQKHDTFS